MGRHQVSTAIVTWYEDGFGRRDEAIVKWLIPMKPTELVWTLLSRSIRESMARVKRNTSHEPNRMLMRENKGFFSFAFDMAHVKYGV